MIVSLEAIFLSTFVMISQNRADAKRQVIADQQWRTVQEEEEQNKQLLGLSRQILALTKEVRGFAGLAQEDHEQNKQLLDLSRRTLALTEEVHDRPVGLGAAAPSGPPRTRNKTMHDAFWANGAGGLLEYVLRGKRSRTCRLHVQPRRDRGWPNTPRRRLTWLYRTN